MDFENTRKKHVLAFLPPNSVPWLLKHRHSSLMFHEDFLSLYFCLKTMYCYQHVVILRVFTARSFGSCFGKCWSHFPPGVYNLCGSPKFNLLVCLSVCLCVTKRIFFCRPLNLKWKIDSRPPLLNYYSTKILNLDIIVKFRILKIMELRYFLRQIKPLCPSVRSWLFSHSNLTQIL